MARDFDGTADYLEATSAPVLALPMTMACWLRSDQSTANQAVMSVGASGSHARCQIVFGGADPGDTIQAAAVTAGNAGDPGISAGSPGMNVWMHACCVFESNTARRAYVNAGGGSTATIGLDSSPASWNYVTIGARRNVTGVGAFFDGKVSEAAVYNVALTVEEIAMLAAGYSPLLVRPQSLVFYAPLHGRNGAAGNEEDWTGGRTLTQTSSPALFDHPRIIYPRRRIWVPQAGITGLPTLTALSPINVTSTTALQRFSRA